ncbi:MAG: TlpA disulfide reductase family protein, partial [Anaerolineales bacterium]
MMSTKVTDDKKSNQKTTLLPILLAGLGLVALIAFALILRSYQGVINDPLDALILPPIKVNQPAPDLTLFNLDGEEVSLSDFRGKVILLNNWATWCPPCREEMPEFKIYYDKYKDQGFQIVA